MTSDDQCALQRKLADTFLRPNVDHRVLDQEPIRVDRKRTEYQIGLIRVLQGRRPKRHTELACFRLERS